MSVSRTGNIAVDEERYTNIVKGIVRKDLKRYLASGRIMFPDKEGKVISIAYDGIEVPSWRFGFPQDEGVGQGEGETGKDLGPASPDDGEHEHGEGGAGHGTPHEVIDVTEDEFAEYLEEALELPRIQPKGDRTVIEEHDKFRTLSRKGPSSMLHARRSLIEALKRSIASGDYAPPQKQKLTLRKADRWFKSWQRVREPKNNAVVFYKRDVSGSMGPDERRVVSYLCTLCNFWLRRNYHTLESVYIIHDDRAHETTREQFFHEDWGGGTTCSSALKKMFEIIEDRFPPQSWNIYSLYLSDGFNFFGDNEVFIDFLGEKLLPIVNQFNYGQISLERPWWPAFEASDAKDIFSAPGTLGHDLSKAFKTKKNVALASIKTGDFESAIDALKIFFGAGN